MLVGNCKIAIRIRWSGMQREGIGKNIADEVGTVLFTHILPWLDVLVFLVSLPSIDVKKYYGTTKSRTVSLRKKLNKNKTPDV